MRLFAYYAIHTLKNQLRKLLKTWVLIFLVVCFAIGGAMGLFVAYLDSSAEPEPEPGWDPGTESADPAEPDPWQGEGEEELSFEETMGIKMVDMLELVVGCITLGLLAFYAIEADKNGGKIFLPADVNLLFPSPMKPQSVLMFRIATQLGSAVLFSVYMLIQMPNLVLNLGFSVWTALSLIADWGLLIIFGTLLQVLLYTLSATYPAVKRALRPGIYGVLLLAAGSFLLYAVASGEKPLKAAAQFFNAPATRFIPVWGWIKGLCVFAWEENLLGAVLCLLGLLAVGGVLLYGIWSIKADFYEDAMAKSEETAELLERAQSEKSSGLLVRRKKDRSESLRRDGMRHGAGANVFFFKSLYNRFRFAHLGFFTKTMETYLVAAVGVSLICRFVSHTQNILPLAFVLAFFAFYRTLGNPLEQDTKTDYFLLIPENTWAKLFWSLMGGTVNCLLDVLPAILVGAIVLGTNPLLALAWIPVIVSVDFYGTTVGTFISLSVPTSAGKTVKQVVQIMFLYFGMLPDIAVAALGVVFGHTVLSMLAASLLNIGLGFLFFGLSPIFIDPKAGKPMRPQSAAEFAGDWKQAKRQFSRLGLSFFAILALSTVLQFAVVAVAGVLFPNGDGPSWLLWVCTFAPLYLVAVPAGLWMMKQAPAAPVQGEQRTLPPGKIAAAFLVSIFALYSGNLLGSLILSLLQTLMGTTAANPMMPYAMEDSVVLRVLVMVLLAPVIEEYLFRKQLIDRTRMYGEKLAVFLSALMFGLFHGNLSQFFYAFALGLVFGYIYLKTGRLRYSMGLHMAVNFLGSVLAPAILCSIPLEILTGEDSALTLESLFPALLPFAAYVLFLIVCSLAGLVLFCIHVHSSSFQTAPLELPRGTRLKTVCGNVGMVLFLASTLALIAASLLAA